MQSVPLEVSGSPIFIKSRILPLVLREPVQYIFDHLVDKEILKSVSSSAWATPIATLLKRDGRTPRICGDHLIMVNIFLKQTSGSSHEPLDMIY